MRLARRADRSKPYLLGRMLSCLLLGLLLPYRQLPAGEREDWPQWGGSSLRNNSVPAGKPLTDWEVGRIRRGVWEPGTARNVKWMAELGSVSFGSPIIAGGRVFIGTNNARGYLKRYPPDIDLGCLLCFDAKDGRFLWQYSTHKLMTGRVNDWPRQGICSSPLVEGDRLWLVTNRCELICLDTEGFHDGEDDGPALSDGIVRGKTIREADLVWKLDLRSEFGVFPHNMANSSPTSWGDTLFLITSNGVDSSHKHIPAPDAPSFLAVDKRTGRPIWKDNSPGRNILHGQWSSPAVGVFEDVPQVIFPGGDGWVYSFRADRHRGGKPVLLWKFDANPKSAVYELGGRGTRNHIVAPPVIHNDRLYISVGDDPEHGEGEGHLWCLDPTGRGDVSGELVVHADRPDRPLPPRRFRAFDPDRGEKVIANPNSAVIWHYSGRFQREGFGEPHHAERMHRSLGSPVLTDNLLFAADFAGFVHCLDARTGNPHWHSDLFSSCWATPLIIGNHLYVGDEDGDVAIFRTSADPSLAGTARGLERVPVIEPLHEQIMDASIYSTPAYADGVLYVATKSRLFAIAEEETSSESR